MFLDGNICELRMRELLNMYNLTLEERHSRRYLQVVRYILKTKVSFYAMYRLSLDY